MGNSQAACTTSETLSSFLRKWPCDAAPQSDTTVESNGTDVNCGAVPTGFAVSAAPLGRPPAEMLRQSAAVTEHGEDGPDVDFSFFVHWPINKK